MALKLARQISESLPEGAKRPVLIAVTGYGSEDDRARTTAAGFDLHLIKPVEPSLLVSSPSPLRGQKRNEVSAPRSARVSPK